MTGDILTQIEVKMNSFTKAEKKVAQFIRANAKEVLYMSITDLADACKVGDTSVFRFCKTLELKGYQEFKLSLAQSSGTDDESAPQLTGKVNLRDSLEEVAGKVLATNVSALNETYALLDMNILSQAIDLMIRSSKMLFVGVGTSSITAMEAKNKFMRITSNADYISDSHLQSMAAALLTPRDLVVAISYSGSTKDIIQIVKLARNAGAKVICITRFAKSPLTSHSDITLLCGANEGPLQGGSLSAKLSQLYLLDILYMEYFKRTFEVSKRNKEITAEAVLDKLY